MDGGLSCIPEGGTIMIERGLAVRCIQHPTYKGFYEPKVGCIPCFGVYRAKQQELTILRNPDGLPEEELEQLRRALVLQRAKLVELALA